MLHGPTGTSDPGSGADSCDSTALLWSSYAQPLPVGRPAGALLHGLGIGITLGIHLYLRREPYAEPGPDADEIRFLR